MARSNRSANRIQQRGEDQKIRGKFSKPREGYGEYQIRNQNNPRNHKFQPLTKNQAVLYSTIMANTLTFAMGPPDTGKSRCAIEAGCELLLSGQIEQLILTTSDFSLEKELGAVPGDVNDKIAPRMRPMKQLLEKILGKSHLENLERNGKVVFEALGLILGLTFDNAFVVVDEAQTMTPIQMKALLTRTGQRTKVVLAGDALDQAYMNEYSGLEDAFLRMLPYPDVGHVTFTLADIVRSDFVRHVTEAYRTKPSSASQYEEAQN
jgi:phosphate starvation-inducible PhoH-like protein